MASTAMTGLCVSKTLWPISEWDIAATVVSAVGGTLAAASGVGGGPIYIPVLLLLGQYPNSVATAISSVLIFGSSTAIFIMLAPRKHPTENRPLIDYDAVALTEPIILAGSIVGVYLNVVLPTWLISILLLLTLLAIAARSVYKGVNQWKKESRDAKRAKSMKSMQNLKPAENGEAQKPESPHFLAMADFVPHHGHHHSKSGSFEDLEGSSEGEQIEMDEIEHTYATSPINGEEVTEEKQQEVIADEEKKSQDETEHNVEEEQREICLDVDGTPYPECIDLEGNTYDMKKREKFLAKIRKQESCRFPIGTNLTLVLAWVVVFLSSLFKGGKSFASPVGIVKCSAEYWVVVVLAFPILIAISACYAIYLRWTYSKKQKLAYPFMEGDIKWTTKNVTFVPTLFFVAGLIAGLLGIGGGMIAGPLFLELGMLIPTSTATSAFTILFTASSTTVQYLIMGSVSWDYFLWYFAFGLGSGFVGQLLIMFIMKRFKRPSIVVFIIAVSIALAALLTFSVGINNFVNDLKKGKPMGFNDVC